MSVFEAGYQPNELHQTAEDTRVHPRCPCVRMRREMSTITLTMWFPFEVELDREIPDRRRQNTIYLHRA